ncbi:hypothetical protein BDN67DRAFT_1016540 [Paxillus ammoniavirescens]|nr:hypothetical protein BDN67DRAFT_1016540 [Paxillus ammoniavirescens]
MSASQPQAKLRRLPDESPSLNPENNGRISTVIPALLADKHDRGPSFSTSNGRQQALVNDKFGTKKGVLVWRAPLLINSNLWSTSVNDWGVPVVADEGSPLGKQRELRVWFMVPISSIGCNLSLVFPNCDQLTVPSPSSSPWASTITVLAQDFYYDLRVADPTTDARRRIE